MKIFNEIEGGIILTEKSENKITKKIILDNLENYLKDYENLDNCYFLLDEQYFSFCGFDIFIEKKQPLNIREIKNIVEEKQKQVLMESGKQGERLFYSIDDIFVNYTPKEYVIGEKGKINFRLNIYYLKKDQTYKFSRIVGSNKLDNTIFKIFPQSYFTINYLKKVKSSKSINILYFQKNTIKLISVKKGSYNNINKLNMGITKLKDMFEEDGIIKLYFDSFSNYELNTISQKLIDRNLNFYNSTICAWLMEQIGNVKDIIIIGDILKNKYFIDNFSKHYTNTIKGFVLPFYHSDGLENFGKRWNLSDIDILTFLNTKFQNNK